MPETSRIQLAVYAIALCAIVWLGARYLGGGSAPPEAVPTVRNDASSPPGIEVRGADPERVTVHVAGAVRHPGVYALKGGSRVEQAVRSAGGATRGAYLDGLNLAGKLEDGRQIMVPRRTRAGEPSAAGAAPAIPGAPDAPIDLNLATLEVLDTLDGVGPATAKKILEYREENGGFSSVDELARVSGIGEKRLASLKAQVRV